ncbi:glycosyltransferase, putative [Medicago truncatula]|uniref:Glycosyltransferase, putative n=1 Tax=Medicago truncatula TaxID=3880 RepID=G7K389_MEDTR|nr:glycosyltransferase, putative [Medicago truncatula]
MKKAEVVIIPSPGVGHLVSTLEFAKLLINRDNRLRITVLVMKSLYLIQRWKIKVVVCLVLVEEKKLNFTSLTDALFLLSLMLGFGEESEAERTNMNAREGADGGGGGGDGEMRW